MKNNRNLVHISYIAMFLTLLIGLPLIFIANADNRLTSAAFPDTGEIIQDIINLLSYHYDQTRPSHLALYGWFYNSIIFVEYFILNKVFFLDTKLYYSLYACLARFNSLIIALAVAGVYPYLLAKFVERRLVIIFGTMCLIFTQPFSLFSFQVHPDNLGVLLSVLTVYFLAAYFENNQLKDLQKSIVFSILSPACKQYYFLLPVMIFSLLLTIHVLSKESIKSFIIKVYKPILTAVFLLFLINPFAFVKSSQFIKYQIWLKNSGFSQGSLETGIRSWLSEFIFKDPILFVGLILSGFFVGGLIRLVINRKLLLNIKEKNQKIILGMLGVYTILHTIWIMISMKNVSLQYFHYFLAVYPYFILFICVLISTLLSLFSNLKVKHIMGSVCGIFCLIVVGKNVIHTIWQCSHYAVFYYTNSYYARDYLRKVNWSSLGVTNKSRILYSTAIPIPDGISDFYINDWAFDTRLPDFQKYVTEWQPDVFIIDHESGYSNTNKFIEVAKKLNFSLKIAEKRFFSLNHEQCNPSRYAPLNQIFKCLEQNYLLLSDKLDFKHASKAISFSVYVRGDKSKKNLKSTLLEAPGNELGVLAG